MPIATERSRVVGWRRAKSLAQALERQKVICSSDKLLLMIWKEAANPLVGLLEAICTSDELSLKALIGVIELIPPHAVRESSFLHHACANRKVSLDIVKCLLDKFPEAAHIRTDVFSYGKTTAYPIHLACDNEFCPRSVVELLAMRFPQALFHLSIVGDGPLTITPLFDVTEGLPLHYYLARETNVDAATVRMLVEQNREALEVEVGDGWIGFTPFHVAINNKKWNPEVVRVLLELEPGLASQRDAYGFSPLRYLAQDANLDESAAAEILKIIIGADHQSVREADDNGVLPIHLALQNRSSAFCKLLIEACPETLRIKSETHGLPIHIATEVECHYGRVDRLQYILGLDPECINARAHYDYNESLPIHVAASTRANHQADVIRFLLSCDPSCASKATSCISLPLHLVCASYRGIRNLDAVKLLFDAYPDAIVATNREGETPLDIARDHNSFNSEARSLVDFLEDKLSLGWLQLHRALNHGASLGTIKLLVNGNPAALQVADLDGDLPLHIACREGNCEAVTYILSKCGSSASERDAEDKLPIHLLMCESSDVDRQSPVYLETIRLLLCAHPGSVLDL